MNIDINRDIVVGFDRDGRPINCWGEIVFWQPRNEMCVSKKLLEDLLRAREEIEEK